MSARGYHAQLDIEDADERIWERRMGPALAHFHRLGDAGAIAARPCAQHGAAIGQPCVPPRYGLGPGACIDRHERAAFEAAGIPYVERP